MQGVRGARARLARSRREPVVAQTVRATAAATLAYLFATHVSRQAAPLTAPLTALLVVQVTLYSTLVTGVRRVLAVVLGVLIASGFSAVVGLSWWSLAMIILAALIVGRLVRVDESVNEVAISAMLVLGVTQVASQAWDRVFETLIGAGVGLTFNLVFAPPVWVDPANESIVGLARWVRGMLVRIGEELQGTPEVERAEARLYEARRLDQHVADVDEALRQAEDSLRLNPRISEGLLSRLVLRTGLDTLEICVGVVRVMARSITDLNKRRDESQPLFPAQVAAPLEDLLSHLGSAVVSFAVLVTAQVSVNAEDAEERLAADLAAAWAGRETVALLLLDQVQEDPDAWQLHGSVLAEIDRILDELDLEHRSRRLMEELDRAALLQRERFDRFGALGRLARGERLRERRR
jgi:Aromatic acid exporter family member 1